MKTFKSLRLSGINLGIYIILVSLSFAALTRIWIFIDSIIVNPEAFSESKIERPIISPFKGSYLYLKSEVLENNQAVYQKIQRNNFIRLTISGLVYLSLFVILILQLRKLLYSIKQKPFFIAQNFKIVKKISFLLFAWVIFDFIMYQSVQFFIPLSLVEDNYNYIPINVNFVLSFFFSVNYSLLLAAFSFYVISVVFNEGIELKEELDLTI